MNCRSLSLREILDVHNNLYRHDGVEIPPPVKLNLYTSPRFNNCLEFISAVLHEGKGLRDCLQLLNLADCNQEAGESITATVTDIEGESKTAKQINDEEKPVPAHAGISNQDTEPLGTANPDEEVEIFDDDESPLHHDTQTSGIDFDRNTDIQPKAESPVNHQPSQPCSHDLNSIPIVALSPSTSSAEQEELLEYDQNPDDVSVSSASNVEVNIQHEVQGMKFPYTIAVIFSNFEYRCDCVSLGRKFLL